MCVETELNNCSTRLKEENVPAINTTEVCENSFSVIDVCTCSVSVLRFFFSLFRHSSDIDQLRETSRSSRTP